MKTNLKLAIAAVLLLAASVWVYADSVSRADRFQRGRKLLPNLLVDEVSTISVTEKGKTTTLERGQDGFTVAEVHDYPAKNEAVNRFLRDLIEIGLEKEVGSGPDLERELAIEPPTDETTEVTLRDAGGEEMVKLRLGKTFTDGAGRYVKRLDQEGSPVYLTSEGVFLATEPSELLKKEIVDELPSEVTRVEGVDFVLAAAEPGSPPTLEGLPAGRKEKTSETAKLRSVLDRLSFDQVYLADDAEVRDLAFERSLRVSLADDTSYTLSTATRGDRTFLQVRGDHSIGQVMITLTTPEDELRDKADQLTRAEEIGKFNEFHGSWVYEIPKTTADKLALRRSDLVE
jgi:hypothetical protein